MNDRPNEPGTKLRPLEELSAGQRCSAVLPILLLNGTNGESETVKFKRSTGQRTTAAKTLCGMLNGTGGMVLFGVNDKGGIVGQDVSEKTLRQLAQESRRIDPFVSLPMKQWNSARKNR
jgi:predicted HTH transcriptional regulator